MAISIASASATRVIITPGNRPSRAMWCSGRTITTAGGAAGYEDRASTPFLSFGRSNRQSRNNSHCEHYFHMNRLQFVVCLSELTRQLFRFGSSWVRVGSRDDESTAATPHEAQRPTKTRHFIPKCDKSAFRFSSFGSGKENYAPSLGASRGPG